MVNKISKNMDISFKNGTSRPNFRLIAEIDEDSISAGFADTSKTLVLTEHEESSLTIPDQTSHSGLELS